MAIIDLIYKYSKDQNTFNYIVGFELDNFEREYKDIIPSIEEREKLYLFEEYLKNKNYQTKPIIETTKIDLKPSIEDKLEPKKKKKKK